MAVGLLAVAALAASVSASPAPSMPAASHPGELRMAATGLVTLRACNHTHNTVLVASSYIPVSGSQWRNKGWTTVKGGACQDIFATTNHTFYVRAEVKGHSDQFWGTDIAQCVEYPGPYDFMTGSNDTTCPEGEPAQFTTFHSDGRPVYVWNLNP
jgi:uncharacterized membrane protein